MAKNNTAQYNAAKKGKEKKTYSPAESAKTFFKSILSNQAAIDGKHVPFYWHIIVALISIVVTWIPLLSKGYTQDNASIFEAAGNGEIDKGFKTLLQRDYFRNDITVKDDKTGLEFNVEALDAVSNKGENVIDAEYNGTNESELAKAVFVDSDAASSQAYPDVATVVNDTYSAYISAKSKVTGLEVPFYYDVLHIVSSETIESTLSTTPASTPSEIESNGYTTYLQTFYLPTISYKDADFNDIILNFQAAVILRADATGVPARVPHSYAIFTKDALLMLVYPVKSSFKTSATASFTGYIDEGFAADRDLVVTSGLSFYNYLSDNGTKSLNDTYAFLHSFMNEAKRSQAIQTVWRNVLIMSGVYVLTVVISASLLLIFHKRKMSIDRDVNFFDTLKEAAFFAFTPSLLSLFGFMNPTFGYALLAGGTLIRVVFSMNKLLPAPAAQNSNKPLYQARS